jgi:hypothetical protein
MVRELEIDPAWCQTGFWIGEEVLEEGRFIASPALQAMCSMARFFCELCDSEGPIPHDSAPNPLAMFW